MTRATTRVVRFPEVLEMTGIKSRETIRQLEMAGHFPRRFAINPGCESRKAQKGWLEHEVLDWLDQRAASREAIA